MTVADSGPPIAYAQIGRLDLLEALFDFIDIPEMVGEEIAPTLPAVPR